MFKSISMYVEMIYEEHLCIQRQFKSTFY
uniref:Uncharacterized protein n=1 Tax=Anguilla anguilla TaxID=7936 RepID=A0A0E9UFA3_ANGAN